MSTVINLTAHEIRVYAPEQFQGLIQPKANLWFADNVFGRPMAAYPPYYPDGRALRVEVNTIPHPDGNLPIAGEIVKTHYERLVCLPEELNNEDYILVSLTTLNFLKEARIPLAERAFSPYKVVRRRENSMQVLGCMGFTN